MNRIFLSLILGSVPSIAAFANDLESIPPMDFCIGDSVCEAEQAQFVADWNEALSGNYQAQRNVSYCLSTGCNSVTIDESHGCAWRLVLINRWANGDQSGTPSGDSLDLEVSSLLALCSDLGALERERATSLAARLAKSIHQNPLSGTVSRLMGG